MIQTLIAFIFGVLAGTLTGLIPGIHINLITIILISVSSALLTITSPLILTIFIVSMAITHTFLDFIPSILLGAPDEDSFLSILPGHQLLLQGRGYYAIVFTLYGSLMALFIIILFTPIFIYLLPKIYIPITTFNLIPFIKSINLTIMPVLLITVSLYLITTEPDKKLWALFIFLLAGFLGIASLNLNVSQPLLPLLTGLFGASNLIISIQQKTKIPEQKITPIKNIRFSKTSITKAFLASIIASPFTAFLPGLGASQAAVIGKQSLNIQDQREFLFLLGAINTIVMGLSFITVYSIEKTRTGAAVALNQLLPELTKIELFYIILTIILSGIFSFIIAVNISKIASKNIHKIPYEKLSIIILIVLILIVFGFSDIYTFSGRILAILIFITSTSLGIFTILIGVKRMHLTGCLLVPTILFYLL